MGDAGGVQLRPITAADIDAAAAFLHSNLNSQLSAETWATAITAPWIDRAPNHGFMLLAAGRVVGVHLAFYSQRVIDGESEYFCNLAAWCVLEDFRSHGLRLLRALLSQRGYHFTDLSPSGSVVELNHRLHMKDFPGSTSLVPFFPGRRKPSVQLITDPSRIEMILTGDDKSIFRDHRRALACRHLVVHQAERVCYLIYRKDRRKRLPFFASLLHVSDADLLRRSLVEVQRHMLWHDGVLGLLADTEVVGHPKLARILPNTRTRMYKSKTLKPDQIGLLYSELTCVPW